MQPSSPDPTAAVEPVAEAGKPKRQRRQIVREGSTLPAEFPKPHGEPAPVSSEQETQAASGPVIAAADGGEPQGLFLAAVLEQTYRHLFGPTSQPAAPRRQQVVSITGLTEKLAYLKEAEVREIREAFHFSDEAHLGQYRQSGEPYITHPVAVAEICAEWKLDAQSIMAALLHDVIEDQGVTQAELAERFNPKVAELVDGLTKIDRLEFQSKEDAQADNFRKMLLAMARDVRVILVKLADRLHNMRTLDHVPLAKRKRIARETMDVYAPIANRLGLNTTYRELQELSFRNIYPFRYATLDKAIKAARRNRREVVGRIMESVRKALDEAGVEAELDGREKTLFSIYRKMNDKHLSFSQVLDVYGFRVMVTSRAHCYLALGALHGLYKPMPGKFKDYIAIPKLNGYQSLHTTLVGPFGTPVEFQIRSHEMHDIAESGVAAHWRYKDGSAELNDLQQHTHRWLQSLIDMQNQTGDSREFLENVKIDLFPDAVYIFTPKGQIRPLPRGATALDFAYAVHSDLGNQCVAVKINNELLPLRTELKNGDIVEVITAPFSRPNPAWLSFVQTGKARSAIRHYLKTMRLAESVELGERLLEQAGRALGIEIKLLPDAVWDHLVNWTGDKTRDQLFADIALGRRVAAVVAKRLELLINERGGKVEGFVPMRPGEERHAVFVSGSEGMSVQLATCCRPISGDVIIGYLGKGEGLQVHAHDCKVAGRLRHKDADRWIEVAWAEETRRLFEVGIRVLILNGKGVLGRIASAIAHADANIVHVTTEGDGTGDSSVLRFIVQVRDRVHLAELLRTLRRSQDVVRVSRERQDG